jgi:GNAT superfamily N-acetyltransferase
VVTIRRAALDESAAVAAVYIRSREASVPAIPPSIHDDDDVRHHFATVVLPTREVWVAVDPDDGIVGFLALHDGWVDHLYLEPGRTGQGLGTQLLDLAKERRPEGIDLWAFQSNVGARRFYERHGFGAVRMTDDDNEEGAPDVLYRWPAP